MAMRFINQLNNKNQKLNKNNYEKKVYNAFDVASRVCGSGESWCH